MSTHANQSFIEVDADILIEMCKKRMDFIENLRLKKANEWKAKAIAKYKEKQNLRWSFLFSKNIKDSFKLNDEDLFQYMLKNCPKKESYSGFIQYTMWELRSYEDCKYTNLSTFNFLEEMISFSTLAKQGNSKIFLTREDFSKISLAN